MDADGYESDEEMREMVDGEWVMNNER